MQERYTFMRRQGTELAGRGVCVTPGGEILPGRLEVLPHCWIGVVCGETVYKAMCGFTDELVAKVTVRGQMVGYRGAEIWSDAALVELRRWTPNDDARLVLELAENAYQSVAMEYETKGHLEEALRIVRSYIDDYRVEDKHRLTNAVWQLIKDDHPIDPTINNLHCLVGAVYGVLLGADGHSDDYIAGCFDFATGVLGRASVDNYATDFMERRYQELEVLTIAD